MNPPQLDPIALDAAVAGELDEDDPTWSTLVTAPLAHEWWAEATSVRTAIERKARVFLAFPSLATWSESMRRLSAPEWRATATVAAAVGATLSEGGDHALAAADVAILRVRLGHRVRTAAAPGNCWLWRDGTGRSGSLSDFAWRMAAGDAPVLAAAVPETWSGSDIDEAFASGVAISALVLLEDSDTPPG